MRHSIAIDIGGTTTTFGIVAEEGSILCKGAVPTGGHGSLDEYLKALHRRLHDIADSMTGEADIVGIGIGAPCANHETGEIEAATDLPWPSPIPLKEIFGKEFGLPVTVANDAKAAAIGEMKFGAARGMRNFIMLTLGTGVGSGIVCDGRLLSGSRGFAGELGHVTVSNDRIRACKCGRYDCLQNYCSASGVTETARRLLKEEHGPSLLTELPHLDPKAIYECAIRGDATAIKVFEETGKAIGRACANFAALTDPEAFIFFGGVAKALPMMEPSIRSSMEENILFLYKDRIKILPSALPEADAALLGASALAFEKID